LAVLPNSDYVCEEEDCGFGVRVVFARGSDVRFNGVGGDFDGLASWGAPGEEMLVWYWIMRLYSIGGREKGE
jgi:hypothetical protein